MLEKFSIEGPGFNLSRLLSLGYGLIGGVTFRKTGLGDELRSLNSLICFRISWLADFKGNGVEVRKTGEDDIFGKGFSLQQTLFMFTLVCCKCKLIPRQTKRKTNNKYNSHT